MIAENALALAYILPADVYLLAGEKMMLNYAEPAAVYVHQPEVQAIVSEPIAQPTAIDIPIVEVLAVEVAPPEIPQIESSPILAPAIPLNYIGGNGQRFLILVHYPDHETMEPSHLSALESTLKRKELQMSDVAIFNIAKHPGTEIKAIGAFFRPRKMLLLGTDTFPVGLTPPVLNQLTKLGKCDMLYSFSFGTMMGNKDNTKAFWEQMKAL